MLLNSNVKFDYAIYTDGSCNNRKKETSGAGVVVVKDGKVVFQDSVAICNDNHTSNRAELLAIAFAFQYIVENSITDQNISIVSDSRYSLTAIKNAYSTKFIPYINGDIINECIVLLEQARNTNVVELRWVKGHNGNVYNELADTLARKGSGAKTR